MYICQEIKKNKMYINKNEEKEAILEPISFTDDMIDALWITDNYIDYFYQEFLKTGSEFIKSNLALLHYCGLDVTDKESCTYGESYYWWALGRPHFWLSPEAIKLTKYPDIAEGIIEDITNNSENSHKLTVPGMRRIEREIKKLNKNSEFNISYSYLVRKLKPKSNMEVQYIKNAIIMDLGGVDKIIKNYQQVETNPKQIDIINAVSEKYKVKRKDAARRVLEVMGLMSFKK